MLAVLVAAAVTVHPGSTLSQLSQAHSISASYRADDPDDSGTGTSSVPPFSSPSPSHVPSSFTPSVSVPVHSSAAANSGASSPGGGSGFSSSSLSSIPGVPASFAACVAFRESTNGTASSNVYGIVPGSGVNVIGKSLAAQKQAFSQLYKQFGASPWQPYDHCTP